MTYHARAALAGLAAVAALVLAACGGDETTAEPAPPPATQPAATETPTTEAATTEAATTEAPTTEAPTTEAPTTEAATTEAATTEAPITGPATEAETHEESDHESPEPAETSAPPAEAPAVEIEFRGGEPVGGVAEIEVKQGDRVDFQVESDVEGLVHVHGYNIEKQVRPSKPARLTFEATLEGIFEVELHLDGEESQIAELTVKP
jgi:hypothetical protein